MENDGIKFDGHGRKSKTHRLTWQGSAAKPKGKDKRSIPTEKRSEAGTKAQLARTANRTPEVMLRVSGGGKTTQHVKDHMDYVTRNGKLEATDNQGDKVLGKQAVADLHSSWNLDLSNGQGKYKQAFNVVLSMPAGTDPGQLLAAVQNFAREELGNHKYMMVLHTRETDPHKDAPEHPHVHLIIKAEDRDRQRLNIRKDTLQAWRESFAEKLRDQGIEANATRRYERGVSQKSKSPAEHQIGKRKGKSTALASRFAEAGVELQRGDTGQKPWELAMAARRRDVARELAASATKLRQEGDIALAASVDRFAQNLPPIQTERQQMQRVILQQQRERLQKLEQDRPQIQEPDQER
jgi:type IV secretion system T-DNA border endonuclease VirD2